MSLRNKWISIIYKVATASFGIRAVLTPVGALGFLILVVLFIIIPLQVDKFLKLPKIFPTPLNIVISLPALAIGLFLTLWSILHFAKVKGTPVPFNPPPKLVDTGPYAHVRNPMTSGVFILLFGIGVLFGSISIIFVSTPLFIFINVLELKAIEEPELEKRLGKEYLEYKRRVPMYIPRLKVKTKE